MPLHYCEYRTRSSALHGQANLVPWLFHAKAHVPGSPPQKLIEETTLRVSDLTSYHSTCCRSTAVTLSQLIISDKAHTS